MPPTFKRARAERKNNCRWHGSIPPRNRINNCDLSSLAQARTDPLDDTLPLVSFYQLKLCLPEKRRLLHATSLQPARKQSLTPSLAVNNFATWTQQTPASTTILASIRLGRSFSRSIHADKHHGSRWGSSRGPSRQEEARICRPGLRLWSECSSHTVASSSSDARHACGGTNGTASIWTTYATRNATAAVGAAIWADEHWWAAAASTAADATANATTANSFEPALPVRPHQPTFSSVRVGPAPSSDQPASEHERHAISLCKLPPEIRPLHLERRTHHPLPPEKV